MRAFLVSWVAVDRLVVVVEEFLADHMPGDLPKLSRNKSDGPEIAGGMMVGTKTYDVFQDVRPVMRLA